MSGRISKERENGVSGNSGPAGDKTDPASMSDEDRYRCLIHEAKITQTIISSGGGFFGQKDGEEGVSSPSWLLYYRIYPGMVTALTFAIAGLPAVPKSSAGTGSSPTDAGSASLSTKELERPRKIPPGFVILLCHRPAGRRSFHGVRAPSHPMGHLRPALIVNELQLARHAFVTVGSIFPGCRKGEEYLLSGTMAAGILDEKDRSGKASDWRFQDSPLESSLL